MTRAAARWQQPDGAPVACTEKLRVLEHNRAELAQMMQDAFDDAVLMGVDAGWMRALLAQDVAALKSPHA
jgi:uncharacterized protein (UPF0335 family)